ncbi:hypothetical protein ACFC0D_17800 [Streptomyces sp. NPDC056222]|uniref:hypothetical protein n=1 Tax=Streptomyces sp. NPDC056222 TaxID=3345749 RepID=UPI0035D90E2C
MSLMAVVVTALAPLGSGMALADADAKAATSGSGILSGFAIQDVNHRPNNNCANTGASASQDVPYGGISELSVVDVEPVLAQISAFNPAFGNTCSNSEGGHPEGQHHYEGR